MINTLSSEDLWVVGASAVLATGVALAVVACGKYARAGKLESFFGDEVHRF